MKKIDNYCLQGHQLFKIDKPAKEQMSFDNYKFKPQEPKSQTPKYFNNVETFKKAWKEKKKNKR